MSIQAIITLSVIAFSLTMLVQFVIGYLAGWRAGHMTGIEYALKIWVGGTPSQPVNKDMTEYTADIIKENPKRLQSVKEETRQQIEELRKSGIK